jgi:hypothetical protein
VIETLVLMFLAVAIDLYLDFLTSKKISLMLWFGLILLLLFLTKGFQSCFIVVLPFSYALFHVKEKKVFWFVCFTSLFLLAGILFLLFVYAPSKNWYNCYYQARLVLTMNNVGATTDKHYQILIQLLMETIAVWLLFLGLGGYLMFKKQYSSKQTFIEPLHDRLGLSFLFTFLAGTLPFTLSLVQRGFYLVPAYLCLTLFLTYTYREQWLYFFAVLNKLAQFIWVKVLILLIFLASIGYVLFNANAYKREKELAHDLEVISPLMKAGTTIGINSNVWNYFNLHSYLYMQKKISLSADPQLNGFVIVYKNELPAMEQAEVIKIELPTQELDLYYRYKK